MLAQAPEAELKAWGLTVMDQTLMTRLEMKRTNPAGVLVHSVRKGGPAGEAKPPLVPGDILLAVEGQPVNSLEALHKVTRDLIKDRDEPLILTPGDSVLLPAHCRHRIDWTLKDHLTIWLAVFPKS